MLGLVPSAILPQAVSPPSSYTTLCTSVFPSEKGSRITVPASKGNRGNLPSTHRILNKRRCIFTSISKDAGLEPCLALWRWLVCAGPSMWGLTAPCAPQPLPTLPRGRTLTYGPPEVFTLADVRELQDFLPLLAFPFAFSSAPCRDGGQMSVDVGETITIPMGQTGKQAGGGSSEQPTTSQLTNGGAKTPA